jgi:beta-glucosidase
MSTFHPFRDVSLILISLSAYAAGAAVDKRVAVPAGYVAPPYYPTPHGGWTGADWAESYRKASLIVSNLTLAEKTNITAGTGIFMGRCVGNTGSALRTGIPQLYVLCNIHVSSQLLTQTLKLSPRWTSGSQKHGP